MTEVNDEQFNGRLNDEDGKVIDKLLEQLADGDKTIDQLADEADGDRERNAAELLSLIGQCPVDAPKLDLTQRTIARVNDVKQKERFASQIESLRGGGSSGFRMSDLITVAAVILIGVGLFSMMLPRIREDSTRVACANQLGIAGAGFGQYAADNRGQLPRYDNVKPGDAWYRVGQAGKSNTANLYILVRDKYVKSEHLACPDNPNAVKYMTDAQKDWPNAEAVSYSYANQFTAKPRKLSTSPRMVLLADKNPLFTVRGNQLIVFLSKSPVIPNGMFHGRKGQNILIADGGVKWIVEPYVERADGSKDNIWMIGNVRHYKGNEVPVDSEDNFLVP